MHQPPAWKPGLPSGACFFAVRPRGGSRCFPEDNCTAVCVVAWCRLRRHIVLHTICDYYGMHGVAQYRIHYGTYRVYIQTAPGGSSGARKFMTIGRTNALRSPRLTKQDQPRLCVWPDGPRSVAVEVPECRGLQARRESFKVSRALPLDATPEEVSEGTVYSLLLCHLVVISKLL